MVRWFWKRWVFAAVCGTTLLVGLAAAQKSDAPAGPPKVGDVITLPFANGVERKVKVIKTEKQPDGSYLSEVKDTKTGETLQLLDKPGDFTPPANAGKPEPARPTTSKSNARPTDPLLPKASMPAEPPKEKEKERRLFGNMSLFSSKSESSATPANSQPQEERPGLLKRIFGRKSSSSNMPAGGSKTTTSTKPANPQLVPDTGAGAAMPPAVRPTPPAPVGTGTPPLFPGGTAEPPRSRAGEPLAPPTPVIPVPVTPPTSPPSVGAPPVSVPSTPVIIPSAPAVPSVPALPPGGTPAPGGLPTIPVPPGGLSSAKSAIVPAGYAAMPMASASAGVMEDVRDDATALRSAAAPSRRALAARALAGCRHGTTDAVKAVLFGTAQDDPCPMVRAVCVEELCKLGYRDPAFMAFLKKACDDPSAEVCSAAKDAMGKLCPKK